MLGGPASIARAADDARGSPRSRSRPRGGRSRTRRRGRARRGSSGRTRGTCRPFNLSMASPSVGDLSPGMSCTIRAGRPGSPTEHRRFRLLNTRSAECQRNLSTRCRCVSSAAVSRVWLPPALLLAAYAVAFGLAALGGGLLVFDDHPGQLYRLCHAVTLGLAPVALESRLVGGLCRAPVLPARASPGWAR